jgi:hypothetical protein
MRPLLLTLLLLPACGGSAFGELSEAPDAGDDAGDVAPDHIADPVPDAGAPTEATAAPPDAGHEAEVHDHDAAPEASAMPEAAPPEAAPPPVDAGPDSSPLAACTSNFWCRSVFCSTDTQFCLLDDPSNTGSCVTFPPQCNTCGSHTCACIAASDPTEYATITSCASNPLNSGSYPGVVVAYTQ